MDWLVKLGKLDRRVIFLLMALAIVIPTLVPMGLPVKPEPGVQAIHAAVEELKPGDKVLISADFDPASEPELYPFLEASLAHLFSRGARVVIMDLWPQAPNLVEKALRATGEGKTRGVDYAHLGYKEGRQLVIQQVGERIEGAYPKDSRGTPLSEIPLMQEAKKLSDFALMLNVSAGSPGTKEWLEYGQSRFRFKMGASCTSVMAAEYTPFVQNGQLIGIAGGLPGSAMYEQMTGWKGKATRGLDVLNFGHILIIVSIILGNIAYFVERRRKQS